MGLELDPISSANNANGRASLSRLVRGMDRWVTGRRGVSSTDSQRGALLTPPSTTSPDGLSVCETSDVKQSKRWHQGKYLTESESGVCGTSEPSPVLALMVQMRLGFRGCLCTGGGRGWGCSRA